VKRAVAALVTLGIGAMCSAPAFAVGAPAYGSAQLKYQIAATASVSIATNYAAATGNTGSGGGAAIPTFISGGTGSCGTAASEATAAVLTFGQITPPSGAGSQTCLYKNAVSLGVESNSAVGVQVFEYLDIVAPTGIVVCAYPTDTALAAKPTGSGVTAVAGGATCAAPTGGVAGTILTNTAAGASSGGTNFGAAGNSTPITSNVNATPLYNVYGAGGFNPCSSGTCSGTSGSSFKFLGEDISISASGAAAATATVQSFTVTYAVIPQ